MNFPSLKLMLFIGLSMMGIASAEEITCELSYETSTDSDLWDCNVKNQAITDPSSNIAPITTQTTVEKLFIEMNPQVKFIPVNLKQTLPDLTEVYITDCSVKSVEDHHFQGLCKLNWLRLSHNNIETISSNAFKDNTNLEHLALDDNKVAFINDKVFSQLQNLKFIHLNNNQISFIDPLAFQNLRSIEHISLDRNKLIFLDPKSFENLVNLKNFDVSYNQLETIDANLFRSCKNLQELRFKGNKLKSIDEKAFDGLEKLIRLDFRSNVCVNWSFSSKDSSELKNALKSNCKTELQVLRNEISDLESKFSSALNTSMNEMTKKITKQAGDIETMRLQFDEEKSMSTSKISQLTRDVEELKDSHKLMRKLIYGE